MCVPNGSRDSPQPYCVQRAPKSVFMIGRITATFVSVNPDLGHVTVNEYGISIDLTIVSRTQNLRRRPAGIALAYVPKQPRLTKRCPCPSTQLYITNATR
jgi:hypothetical protein